MKIIKISTPAKINIGLQVLNRRNDGFHNINTLFFPIKFFDEITLEKSEKFQLECYPELNINTVDNLIFKAYNLLKENYNLNSEISVKLKKNIPMGAGMGGGSSDAAAVLLGLRKLFSIDYSYKSLHEIAIRLGSDVPFFLKRGVASGCGRGEILKYYNFKLDYKILIVYPNVNISTKWAYGELKRDENPVEPINFSEIIKQTQNIESSLKKYFFNDFETFVFQRYPEIRDIKSIMYKYGAVYSQLSGSGSAVFGLFSDDISIQKCKNKLSNYQVFETTFI